MKLIYDQTAWIDFQIHIIEDLPSNKQSKLQQDKYCTMTEAMRFFRSFNERKPFMFFHTQRLIYLVSV